MRRCLSAPFLITRVASGAAAGVSAEIKDAHGAEREKIHTSAFQPQAATPARQTSSRGIVRLNERARGCCRNALLLQAHPDGVFHTTFYAPT